MLKELFARIRGGNPSLSKPFPDFQLQAGKSITQQTALTYSAVFACVRVISETIAALPWNVYLRRSDDSRERQSSHPVDWILSRQPNPEMTAFDLKETLVAHALTHGNGYAEIVRDNAGRVVELWPMNPEQTECRRDRDTGALYYEVYTEQERVRLDPRDVFHLHGLGFDGRSGYSVISLAARSIGGGIAAEEYFGNFFGNGAWPGGVIVAEPGAKGLSADGVSNLLQTFNRQHRGSVNAHRVHYLDAGLKYETLGVPPQDAQLLEGRKFSLEEICRWFRVPPHKVANLERATFSNIEHQSIEFVTDTVLPWITRLELAADTKLFGFAATGKLYTKFNVSALLRGDFKARQEGLQIQRRNGIINANEWRALEEMNPIDGEEGEKYIVEGNMTTLESVGETIEPLDLRTFATETEDDSEEDTEDEETEPEDSTGTD